MLIRIHLDITDLQPQLLFYYEQCFIVKNPASLFLNHAGFLWECYVNDLHPVSYILNQQIPTQGTSHMNAFEELDLC